MTDSRIYKIDYRDGDVLRWSLTDDSVEYTVDESYTPTLYVSAHNDGSLAEIQSGLDDHPAVAQPRRQWLPNGCHSAMSLNRSYEWMSWILMRFGRLLEPSG